MSLIAYSSASTLLQLTLYPAFSSKDFGRLSKEVSSVAPPIGFSTPDVQANANSTVSVFIRGKKVINVGKSLIQYK